jgi:hypothetical protein
MSKRQSSLPLRQLRTRGVEHLLLHRHTAAHPGSLCWRLLDLVAVKERLPAHTQEGDTALSLALIQSSKSGRLDVVRLLLDSKADIHAASKVNPPLPLNPIVFIPLDLPIRFLSQRVQLPAAPVLRLSAP